MIRDPNSDEVKRLCRKWSALLNLRPGDPNGAALLYALFLCERYNEDNPLPRLEKAYCEGGRYFNPTLWAQYGFDSARSWSNWQIMYPVAVEMGFSGLPQCLDYDDVALRYVVELLNRRIFRQARKDDGVVTLREVFDAYNSGNCRDNIVPEAYIQKGLVNYGKALTIFL